MVLVVNARLTAGGASVPDAWNQTPAGLWRCYAHRLRTLIRKELQAALREPQTRAISGIFTRADSVRILFYLLLRWK